MIKEWINDQQAFIAAMIIPARSELLPSAETFIFISFSTININNFR